MEPILVLFPKTFEGNINFLYSSIKSFLSLYLYIVYLGKDSYVVAS